jgi:hypothetical protein
MRRRPPPTRPHRALESLRLRLSRPDALFWPALLGLLTGLSAGIVIVAFRLAVEGSQGMMLPGHGENYEALPVALRLALPLVGSLLIGILFVRFANGIYVLGVARVMERMEYHQGHLTLRGFIMQFVGAAIAIVSGHSVGREGPPCLSWGSQRKSHRPDPDIAEQQYPEHGRLRDRGRHRGLVQYTARRCDLRARGPGIGIQCGQLRPDHPGRGQCECRLGRRLRERPCP